MRTDSHLGMHSLAPSAFDSRLSTQLYVVTVFFSVFSTTVFPASRHVSCSHE